MSDAFADAGRLRQELDSVWKMHDLLKRENADLRAKLEEARKDAERYRWLRDTQSESYGDEFGFSFSYEMGFDDFKQPKRGLDAAIDSAMGDK